MENRINIQEVGIEELKANPWNPNVQTDFIFEKERASIREHGFIDPVLVREKGKTLEIIDGEHRWRAAKAEGMKRITINNLGKVDDQIAKRLTIIMNETRGRADHDKMSALLLDLNKTMSIEDLVAGLPYTTVEIDAMLAESAVDWDKITPELSQSKTTTVIGGENPIPAPDEPADRNQKDPKNSSYKVLTMTLPEKLHGRLFSLIDEINKILHPKIDPEKMSPVAAVQIIVDVMQQTDLKTVISKGSKKLIRRSKADKK